MATSLPCQFSVLKRPRPSSCCIGRRLVSPPAEECINMHEAFHTALLDPDRALPSGLTSWNRAGCERRFAVYRNNVVTSLIDVLAGNFPVVQQLVGEAFFRAMGREFVTHNPPDMPVM